MTDTGGVTLSKKVIDFPVPSRDVTYQTLPVPAWESLVSDIAPGDGKMYNLFLQCSLSFTSVAPLTVLVSIDLPTYAILFACWNCVDQ
jgi:hypothetical protein